MADQSSAPLDIEACVRLLTTLAGVEEDVFDDEDNAKLLRALASALPGMGKALEDCDEMAGVQEEIDAWCERSGSFGDGEQSYAEIVMWMGNRLDSLDAARASQPEETNDAQL